ncbi:MAG TPA: 2-C-methyl-D-erythritol 2,4-cyclodiphosphate synthase [Candidatus Aminicenantes bacterium]|nr:2-C-methyl-D-erythritol 2,4-cyclodiphosphate synthase [Candidatus Aminicenantes bacterium]HRY64188.1 2-C-methyl-D-erythritol 2,4-cyclodiphosphate synthase [Candidatus Aminicenantes bacterium]HRZ71101.1 2-C-methyl-D-erythritol 2,4-cyclodiphosphate synthase [Candidatus Aminicenantes bacterium]
MPSKTRTGFGYDIHRLEAGRRLVLGGVDIPHPAGLLGHSDGDALVHAVIDALLGALAEGDIGALFPDTDPRYKGARSLGLLETVMGRLRARGAAVVNVDAVIVAEEPKMGPHIPAMRAALAPVLGLPETAVGLKAKTNEGLGPVGERRAIACFAVALLSWPD